MFRSAIFGICIIVTGLLLQGPAALAQQMPGTRIERIDIRGNRRVPEDNIRFYIQSRPGEPYDVVRLERDLRELYRSNSFENIEIQERDGDVGKIITFVVKEKPLIRAIEYSGNKSFAESDILDAFKEKKVGVSIDSQYDPSKVRAAERALRDLMLQNGKPLGTVRTEIEPIPPSSVRIRFLMDEGPKVRIGQIRFTGNKVFNDGKLKDALQLNKERNIFTMFKGTDKYHKEKLEYDIETNLKAFYQEHGYMQVQIGQPVTRIFEGPRGIIPMLRKTREQFFIEIPIDAGDQYRIGKFELENCGILDCQQLVKVFGLKKGDIMNYKRIKDTLEEIKKLYGNLGYINWSYLHSEQSFDQKNKTINLVLTFEPDKQFFVRRINFLGNTKTRDKVMRREFDLEEGHAFSSMKLDTSILRLNQLGFFERIEEQDYEVKPDDKTGLVDVDIKVKEKSQQSIGFTGGVSGISGSFIGINYTTNNFMGRGESLEFSITGGTRQTNFIAAFTEPYLLDSRWSMGLSVFNQRYRYDSYVTFGLTDFSGEPSELFTQKTTGTTVSLSRRLGRSLWSVGSSYTFQKIGVSDIAPGMESWALGQFIGFTSQSSTAAVTGIKRSEITPMLSYNSTDSYFFPRRGSSFMLSAAISGGVLGGDFNMFRPVVQYRRFFPDRWLSNGRNVFAFNLQGQFVKAYGNSIIPFFDRFFIGGEDTIRGFDIRSLSPIAVTSNPLFDSVGNPVIDPKTGLPMIQQSAPFAIGGDTVGLANFEYRIPIAGPLSIAAFYDVGIVRASLKDSLGTFSGGSLDIVGSTNNAVRGSTGMEVQFVLPVVSAPFRLIFAYNPHRLNSTFTAGGQVYQLQEPKKDIKFTVGRSF
ncbi:MAG: outer membrane protein assembly factor BamA [Acidobacteria bacterium]|nr:outer membrane protein assembly factor BamA [Acidobacteriota bacterium]